MFYYAKFHLQRYGDFTVFKLAPVRHLGFLKSNFLTAEAVNRTILHQRTKFRKDRSNRCGDVAIFVIFQDGGRRHLGFSKIRNFNGRSAVRVQYASLYQISSKSVKRLQRYGDLTVFFQNGGRRHLGAYWDHPRRQLDGLHCCAKFGRNRCRSFDNMKLSIFCQLGLKTPIHAPRIGVFGDFTFKMGSNVNETPKMHICGS